MKITRTLASADLPDGSTISLQEHDGQFYLRMNGAALMSTTANASEQKMAAVACERFIAGNKSKARILIGGLGFGFTLRRVLELVADDAVVEIAELLPEIIEWNRHYLQDVNGLCLDDARVTIHRRDVFDLIEASAEASGSKRRERHYDAILLDVDNSPDPFVQSGNGRLYERRGLEIIRNALAPGGRVVFWSGNADRGFENELRKVFARSETIAARAYPQAKRSVHTLFVADGE